jgi:hypothetical protein
MLRKDNKLNKKDFAKTAEMFHFNQAFNGIPFSTKFVER